MAAMQRCQRRLDVMKRPRWGVHVLNTLDCASAMVRLQWHYLLVMPVLLWLATRLPWITGLTRTVVAMAAVLSVLVVPLVFGALLAKACRDTPPTTIK
jgi:hypothetical protein